MGSALASAESPIPASFSYLDPAAGSIDGQAALAVIPREEPSTPATSLVAKLSPMGGSGIEFSFPVGTWFIPPTPRKYRVWLESEWQMSRVTQVIVWRGGPFRTRGMVVRPLLGPAGRVKLPKGFKPEANLNLRLLALGDYLDQGFLRWEVTRQQATEDLAASGILMPAGPTLAALWDTASQQYVALSKPFTVEPGQIVEAPFDKPSGKPALVLLFEDHRLPNNSDPFEVVLAQAGKQAAPAVLVRTAQTVYAVWYELEAGTAELLVTVAAKKMPPFLLELQESKISRVSVDLKRGLPVWQPWTPIPGLQ